MVTTQLKDRVIKYLSHSTHPAPFMIMFFVVVDDDESMNHIGTFAAEEEEEEAIP